MGKIIEKYKVSITDRALKKILANCTIFRTPHAMGIHTSYGIRNPVFDDEAEIIDMEYNPARGILTVYFRMETQTTDNEVKFNIREGEEILDKKISETDLRK